MKAWTKAKELTNEVSAISKEKTETLFTPKLTDKNKTVEVNDTKPSIDDIKNIK